MSSFKALNGPITKPSQEAKHPVTMLSIARQLQKPFSCNTESDNSVINKEITEQREGTATCKGLEGI